MLIKCEINHLLLLSSSSIRSGGGGGSGGHAIVKQFYVCVEMETEWKFIEWKT